MLTTAQFKAKLIRSTEDQQRQEKAGLVITPSDKPVIAQWWLPYQVEAINNHDPFVVYEKGRRVGLSEALAYRSNIMCLNGIQDTYYSTYNLPASKVFIKKCAKWAKAFHNLSVYRYNKPLIDLHNGINYHRVQYLNGRFIEAIPDTATSFRDKESRGTCIIKDEAAFSSQLREINEAVKALNMWGGKSCIKIVSTHFGEKNEFNSIVQTLRKDPKAGTLKRIDFYDAVAQGLYKQMCLVNDETWTEQAEKDYVDYWVNLYGEAAPQELGAIPRRYGDSKIFQSEIFCYGSYSPSILDSAVKIRTWDFAATSKEKAKEGSFYTASVIAAVVDGTIVIMDVDANQYSPDDVEAWLVRQAGEDDPLTMFVVELEPGSNSRFFTSHLSKLITNRNVDTYSPASSKVVRAMPLIAALKNNHIVLWEENKAKLDRMLVQPMTQFDGQPRPLVNDVTDCMSMLYGYYEESLADWIAA